MAWFPGAVVREVTRHRTPLVLASDGTLRATCNHVAVTEAASLFGYFDQPGNPTSHFYVRYSGVVEQYVSTAYRAPAQLEGNATVVSLETQGGTEPNCAGLWHDAQAEAIARIHAWLADVHGLPLVAMPDSRPASRGVGYHRLGVDPWRVAGGELWSQSYGKICPCPNRIAQLPGIITRARAIRAEGDDGAMAWTDAQINELLSIWRTHAVRMDNLVNQQLPDLRAKVESLLAVTKEVRQETSLTAIRVGPTISARVDELAATAGTIEQSLVLVNSSLGALVSDTDRVADWAVGPDASGT